MKVVLMDRKQPKIGLIFVSIYIILVIAAIAFLVVMLTKYPEKAEFAGVYIGILTLPWSFAVLKSLGAHANSIALLISLFSVCAIVNAVILYWVGNKLGKNW
jgi:hypothetical protein